MSTILSPLPIQKFFDNNGRPLSGGQLFTYKAATSTKQATYIDSTGGTPNTNPIVLDFRGECRLWIDPTLSYKFVLSHATDTDPPTNPIWSVDNITAFGSGVNFDNTAVDTGSVNAVSISIPVISSPIAFTRIIVKIANTNTNATTLTLNGGTAKSVTLQNLTALSGGELIAGGIYQFIFDGAQWQLQDLVGIPRTSAEISSGVPIVNGLRSPGDVERYGSISNLSSWTAAKAQFLAGGSPIKQLPITLTYFGGTPNNSSFDNAAAFNTAVSFCASLGYQEIFFPGANNSWYFNTKPNAITAGILLRGENPRAFLVRNYTAGTAFESFLEWNGSLTGGGDLVKGGGMEKLGLLAGTATSNGAAINILGTDTTNRPGYMSFRDVVITANGQWSFGIRIDGTNITTAGSQGQRDHYFGDIQIFRCANAHIQVSNGVHFFFNSIGLFDGGLGGTPLFNITGAGAATSNSDEVHVTNLNCEGNLTIQNCTNVVVTGRVVGTLTIANTATNVAFMGTANTVANTCTSAVVVDSANGMSISAATGFSFLNNSIPSFTAISATATAGGGALPAAPTGFLNVVVNGTARRIPYYNV